MKLMFALLALAPFTASAADYASCKEKLSPIAEAYASYMAAQTPACVAEMNKNGKERSRVKIIMNCSNALGILQPLKDKSGAACDECRSIDAKIASACSDDGAQNFVDRVRAL